MATDTTNAVETRPASRVWQVGERLSFWRIVAQLAPFVLAFSVYLAVFLVMRPGATGDEPHYLVTAESIAYDLDVDLRNDYASRERVLRVVNVFPLEPHAGVYKKSGELRPFRGVGLPALLSPGVALGGLTGARLVMVLIAALLADQLYRLLRDLRFRRPYRALAWGAALFCLPVIVFSSQIYPELPGALLVVVALRVMVVGASRPAALALGSSAAAALVWLHVRYLSLSVGILFGLALAACLRGWSSGGRGRGLHGTVQAARALVVRCAVVVAKRWRAVTLPVLAPYAIGMGVLAAAFQHWYGSLDPRTPYEALGGNRIGSGGWDFWYEFALRDILDPVAGWIPFAPVHWLGFAALGSLVVWFGWRAVAWMAAAAGYELLVASVGPSVGWGLPGRYPMIVIPLIAIPIALVIQEVRAARVAFVPLLAGSLLFVAVALDDFQGLYPIGDKPRMLGLRTTAAAFPRTQSAHLPTSFAVVPGQAPHQTGRVRGETIVAKTGRDGAGYLLWGPYASLREGRYRATFPLAITGVRGEVPVATVEVAGSPPSKIFARKVITAAEVQRPRPSRVSLQFKTPGGYLTETRVFYNGLGTLTAGPVDVEAVRVARSTRVPAWALAALWITGTVLAGWLFVRLLRRRPQSARP